MIKLPYNRVDVRNYAKPPKTIGPESEHVLPVVGAGGAGAPARPDAMGSPVTTAGTAARASTSSTEVAPPVAHTYTSVDRAQLANLLPAYATAGGLAEALSTLAPSSPLWESIVPSLEACRSFPEGARTALGNRIAQVVAGLRVRPDQAQAVRDHLRWVASATYAMDNLGVFGANFYEKARDPGEVISYGQRTLSAALMERGIAHRPSHNDSSPFYIPGDYLPSNPTSATEAIAAVRNAPLESAVALGCDGYHRALYAACYHLGGESFRDRVRGGRSEMSAKALAGHLANVLATDERARQRVIEGKVKLPVGFRMADHRGWMTPRPANFDEVAAVIDDAATGPKREPTEARECAAMAARPDLSPLFLGAWSENRMLATLNMGSYIGDSLGAVFSREGLEALKAVPEHQLQEILNAARAAFWSHYGDRYHGRTTTDFALLGADFVQQHAPLFVFEGVREISHAGMDRLVSDFTRSEPAPQRLVDILDESGVRALHECLSRNISAPIRDHLTGAFVQLLVRHFEQGGSTARLNDRDVQALSLEAEIQAVIGAGPTFRAADGSSVVVTRCDRFEGEARRFRVEYFAANGSRGHSYETADPTAAVSNVSSRGPISRRLTGT